MDLHEDLLILNTILKDKDGLPNLKVDEYNDVIKFVNISLFEKILKKLKQDAVQLQISTESNIAKNEDLRPFKVTKDVALTVGVGTLPTTFVIPISANAIYNLSVRNVEIVSEEEKDFRIGNMISPPIDDYPICTIDTSVRVWPTDVTSLNLSYIKKPTTPVYAVAINTTTGLNTYSEGSSTQFEWNEQNRTDLILEMITYLGISASFDEIKKYTER